MKNPRIRDLIRQAQAAELEGDRIRAVTLLQEAAQLHLEAAETSRAAALLRHCLRLDPERTDLKTVLERAERSSPSEASERGAAVNVERGPVKADPSLDCWCSFCCRPKNEVGHMIAGPAGAFICLACLRRACELVNVPAPHGSAASALDGLAEEVGVPFIDAAVVLSRSLGWSLDDIRKLTPLERRRAVELLEQLEGDDSDVPRA